MVSFALHVFPPILRTFTHFFKGFLVYCEFYGFPWVSRLYHCLFFLMLVLLVTFTHFADIFPEFCIVFYLNETLCNNSLQKVCFDDSLASQEEQKGMCKNIPCNMHLPTNENLQFSSFSVCVCQSKAIRRVNTENYPKTKREKVRENAQNKQMYVQWCLAIRIAFIWQILIYQKCCQTNLIGQAVRKYLIARLSRQVDQRLFDLKFINMVEKALTEQTVVKFLICTM